MMQNILFVFAINNWRPAIWRQHIFLRNTAKFNGVIFLCTAKYIWNLHLLSNDIDWYWEHGVHKRVVGLKTPCIIRPIFVVSSNSNKYLTEVNTDDGKDHGSSATENITYCCAECHNCFRHCNNKKRF